MNVDQDNNSKRISFESSSDNQPAVNKSIKISNNKSRFAQQRDRKAKFDEYAKEVHNRREGYQYEAIKLGQEFNKFFKDKTLPENKGPLEKSFELEIINKLISYAIAVNNDEAEPQDGMGSVAIITLLINVVLRLKDQQNHYEYNHHLLKQEIASLKTQIDKLLAQKSENDR